MQTSQNYVLFVQFLNIQRIRIMALYETTIIARQNISRQAAEDLAVEFTKVAEGLGGLVKKNEYWGLLDLATEIKKNTRGHYVLLGLDAPYAAMQEMERQLHLHEDVIRYMTLRVEEISDEPSPMMRQASDAS